MRIMFKPELLNIKFACDKQIHNYNQLGPYNILSSFESLSRCTNNRAVHLYLLCILQFYAATSQFIILEPFKHCVMSTLCFSLHNIHFNLPYFVKIYYLACFYYCSCWIAVSYEYMCMWCMMIGVFSIFVGGRWKGTWAHLTSCN